ncbi:MAG: GNAT family protein [Sporichthyaceae bacterium]
MGRVLLAGQLDFGFDELALPEIVAFTQPFNERSLAVMHRLGMTYQRDCMHVDPPACRVRLTTSRRNCMITEVGDGYPSDRGLTPALENGGRASGPHLLRRRT